MIGLDSLRKTMRKVENLRKALPIAAQRIALPGAGANPSGRWAGWKPFLENVARETLNKAAGEDPAAKANVVAVMASYTVTPLAPVGTGGAVYSLTIGESLVKLGIVQSGQKAQFHATHTTSAIGVVRQRRPQGMSGFPTPSTDQLVEMFGGTDGVDAVKQARAAVVEWVDKAKHKAEEDIFAGGAPDPDAPEYSLLEGHILALVGLHPTRKRNNPWKTATAENMTAAGQSLMTAIGPWVQKNIGGGGALSGGSVAGIAKGHEWLGLVSAAWQDVAPKMYVRIASAELRRTLAAVARSS